MVGCGRSRSRLQAQLLSLGVAPGDRVAVLLPNGPDYFKLVFACSFIGAVVVHVHTAARGAMLQRALGLSQPACIMIDADAADRLDSIELPGSMRVVALGRSSVGDAGLLGLTRRATWSAEAEQRTPRSPSCIYSSSGTTGPAKGVTLSHEALFEMARTAQIVMDFGPQDVAYTVTPFYHANALVFMFLAAALAGSETVFAERFSVSRFWDDVAHYGATRTSLVGSAADLLLSQPTGPADAQNTLELIAAVPRPRETDAFEQRFGVRLTEFYGSTEANLPIGIPVGEQQPRTCGRALPGWTCKVVDSDGYEVTLGQDGELLKSAVARNTGWWFPGGYWGEPERTCRQHVARPMDHHRRSDGGQDEHGWFYYRRPD